MNDFSKDTSSFSSFEGEVKAQWKELAEIALEKCAAEAVAASSAGVANPFLVDDYWDGYGQLWRIDFEGVKSKMTSYIENCCFPEMDCSEISSAAKAIDKSAVTFDPKEETISEAVDSVDTGLDSWNTGDQAREKGISTATGPAEIFDEYYVKSISPVAAHQHAAHDLIVEMLKVTKGLVVENRLALLENLQVVKNALNKYDPASTAISAGISSLLCAANFIFPGASAIFKAGQAFVLAAADILVSKGMTELGMTEDANVVLAIETLGSGISKLEKERRSTMEDFGKVLGDLHEDLTESEHMYVCKRPSQLSKKDWEDDYPKVRY